MPLSNLLLVFCPSLSMSPPLLRVLCEAEGIWDVTPSPSGQPGVLDIKRKSIVMDIGLDTPRQSESLSANTKEVYPSTPDKVDTCQGLSKDHDSASQEIVSELHGHAVARSNLDSATTQRHPERSGSPAYGSRPLPRAPLGARRGPVATLYLDSECADGMISEWFTPSPTAEVSPPGSQSLKCDASFSRSSSVSPPLPNPYSPPSLSSSTDSLTSSESPSSSHHPMPKEHFDKTEVSSRPRSPAIIEPADLPFLRTPHRSATSPATGGDIQFPSTGSLPTPPLNRPPSVPKLSPNGSTPHLHGPASTPSLRTRRIKKPSLNLLFTRRSSASLHSASINPASISGPTSYLQHPHSASPLSSASTPLSAQQSLYTAQTSTSSLPPVLNMPIETSPFQMDMGTDDNKRRTISAKPGSSHSNHTAISSKDDKPSSSPLSVNPGPNETPIANLYSTPSNSVLSFDSNENIQPLRPRPRPRPSQSSIASSKASFNHLSMVLPDEETAEEDWAQSVLAAANTDGSWTAKNVMKFFGGGG